MQVILYNGCKMVVVVVLVKGMYTVWQQESGPMPNVMAALPNIGGALCSMQQSLADAHY